jgi:protein ImuB
MGLRGCISIDSLPLQVLLNDNPGWAGTPVAVTREERPQSPILALNREAREKGLAVGMKYSSALSIVPDLRARAVPADRIAEARAHVVQSLLDFTPDIELCPFDSDALWVSVEGLRSLYASETRWSHEVRGALEAEGFKAVVVIGFTRFGTYAIARTGSRSCVFASRKQEQEMMGRSPVDILPLPQRMKSTLRKLEIRTVHHFVSLPEGETIRRFGKEAGALVKAIISDDPLPIQPVAVIEKVTCCRHLDAPVVELSKLMPHIDELLAIEAERAGAARSVISGLTLILRTEDGKVTTDMVRPAAPTLQTSLLMRLIALRLSGRQFSSGVEDIEIRSARTMPSRTQEELFRGRGRDLKAGARAMAAIRARFGNDSVLSAQLCDSWLPERSFKWVPLKGLSLPSGGTVPAPRSGHDAPDRQTAVRRVLSTPRQIQQGRAGRVSFALSGSWWGTGERDSPFHREYSFQDSARGVLWLYVDKLTGLCWLQGVVD